MKRIMLLVLTFVLCGCATITPPKDFVYKEIRTRDFDLASWQKITAPDGVYKIYIEGDGHAFNSRGFATTDPTPKGTLVREIAFGDPSPNVVYLARPCQYIKSPICSKRHWTSARFAHEVIISTHDAIRQIAGNHPVILIGYSGGAQVAGLIATAKTGLDIKKVITIAGNLDHLAWTEYQQLPPLNESMNLESYRRQYLALPQMNYVGEKDKVIPPFLTKAFLENDDLITIVPNANHGQGWESIYPLIWNEK